MLGAQNRLTASPVKKPTFDKFGYPDLDKKTTKNSKHKGVKGKKKEKNSENSDICMTMKSS